MRCIPSRYPARNNIAASPGSHAFESPLAPPRTLKPFTIDPRNLPSSDGKTRMRTRELFSIFPLSTWLSLDANNGAASRACADFFRFITLTLSPRNMVLDNGLLTDYVYVRSSLLISIISKILHPVARKDVPIYNELFSLRTFFLSPLTNKSTTDVAATT